MLTDIETTNRDFNFIGLEIMQIFNRRKKNLPVPMVDTLQREMSERDVNFAVKLLAEFCLFLLTRAKRASEEERRPLPDLPQFRRQMISPGVTFPPAYRNEW
jgi:hypothetical protein